MARWKERVFKRRVLAVCSGIGTGFCTYLSASSGAETSVVMSVFLLNAGPAILIEVARQTGVAPEIIGVIRGIRQKIL